MKLSLLYSDDVGMTERVLQQGERHLHLIQDAGLVVVVVRIHDGR